MTAIVGSAEFIADQPLRLAQPNTECCEQTPATDGSFFVDRGGKCPTDDRTGMPLPIAPSIDLASLPQDKVNEHHHFYPKLSPVLRNSLGGKALRASRIQRVAITQHNFGEVRFHKFFPEGPEIPTDANAQLGLCVLACAGYIPEKVVDTTNGEPIVRGVKDWEHTRLGKPSTPLEPLPYQVKRFRDRRFPGQTLWDAKSELMSSRRRQAELTYENLIYGFDPMKDFMLSQVLQQDFSEVDNSLKLKFLEKDDIEAGLCILAIGAVFAAEAGTINGKPLNDIYREIQVDKRLHHRMPQAPATLIKHKLGHIEHRIEILPALKSTLEAQREQRVA